MAEQAIALGPLMKAARKFRKFNQADVAQAIGCSQSALSKMEHNILVPSAPQWFLFARFTSIPPETLETGIIDRHTIVKFNNEEISQGFKIPKRYRVNRAEKVRELYPFLFYLEKNMGGDVFTEFIRSTGLDPEYFLDFDNLINFQLLIDTMNFFIKLGKTGIPTILSIVELGQNDVYWNHQNSIRWKRLGDVSSILSELAHEQPFFQADFNVVVEREGERIFFSYDPLPHLFHVLKDLNLEVEEFWANYRKFSIENLIFRALGTKIEAELQPKADNTPLKNRFEIKT